MRRALPGKSPLPFVARPGGACPRLRSEARRWLRLRGRRGLRSEEKAEEEEDALKLFIMSGRPRVT